MSDTSEASSPLPPAVALLTVMGLPGAGKTTLCRLLCKGGGCGGGGSGGGGGGGDGSKAIACVHLEFDTVVPDSIPAAAAAAAAATNDACPAADAAAAAAAWKRARDGLLRSLDRLLSRTLRPDVSSSDSRRSCYYPALDGVEDDDQKLDGLLASQITTARLNCSGGLVLLLDDNFYYASMRHAVFQLARFYKCGYGTVYLKVGAGHLKLVNALREKSVPDGVIDRMSRRLEAPNVDRNPWEKFTCVLNGCDMGFLDCVGHYSDSSVNGRLHAFIRDCLAHPFEPPPLELAEAAARQAEEARVVCSLSLLHQADLRLRVVVSDWLAAKGGGEASLPEADKAELGRLASNSKRALMSALRDGKLKVPAGLNAAYSPDMRDKLDAFLRDNLALS